MFTLVRFDDNSVGIYPTKSIKKIKGHKCTVKHKGCNYEADLVSSHDSKKFLTTEKNKLGQKKIEGGDKLRAPRFKQPVQADNSDFTHYDVNGNKVDGGYSELPSVEDSSIGSESNLRFEQLVQADNSDFTDSNTNGIEVDGEYLELPSVGDSFGSELNYSFSFTELETSRSNILSFDGVENIESYPTPNISALEQCPEPEEFYTTGQQSHNITEDQTKKNKYCKKLNGSDLHVYSLLDQSDDSNDDDPSYKPDENEVSDVELHAESSPAELVVKKKSRFSDSLNSSTNISRCDDNNMYVEESRGRSGDKKGNFCYYCKTKQQKIVRHLESKHKEEEDVKKFLHLPKGSAERRQAVAIIRKKGNFIFNTRTDYNDGELIVSRRPSKNLSRSAVDFRACANCKAFYSKNTLRQHFRQCTGEASSSKRITQMLSRRITSRMHTKASSVVRKDLIPVMREDDITRLIRYDELMIIYANKMTEKYRNPRHYDMIRQRMRLLGRFFLIMKKMSQEVTTLSSIFDPKFTDQTMLAINEAARFNKTTCNYEAPTVAFNLGSLLKQVGHFFITECIKNHRESERKNAKDYLKLLTQEINISVNRNVTESQLQMRRRKKVVLPSNEDIRRLHNYITKIRVNCSEKIRKEFSFNVWLQLAETTLMSVQLFNRRRAGEVERILIADFKSYQGIDEKDNQDLFKTLNAECKLIAKKYVRFAIRGKLNRTVPVLLDRSLLRCIMLVLEYRDQANVASDNPYVFGIPGRLDREFKYLRACQLMRKYSEQCGADHPDRLRGTNLRKHIATTCITLNLEDQEVTDLANFMGHAEKIHKDIYRQPVMSRDILRMSQLLEAAQGGDSDSDSEPIDHQKSGDMSEKIIDTSYHHRIDHESDHDDFLNRPKKRNPQSIEKKKKRSTSPYGKTKRTRWTEEEKSLVFREFSHEIMNRTLPSLAKIQEVIRENPIIQDRTSPQVKTWIHNQFKKK